MDRLRRRTRLLRPRRAGLRLLSQPEPYHRPEATRAGQLRAGYARGSRFVFSQHCKAGRDAGLREEQIQAIPAWAVATCFSPLERAVLAYTDCLVLEGGRVPDMVFEALRRELDDAAILELTYVTCMYEMHATMCRALRLEFDDVDDPVTEVPAPDARRQTRDVMGMVDAAATRRRSEDSD